MSPAPRITVVGSANTDLVARCEKLPRPGETVTDAALERIDREARECVRRGALIWTCLRHENSGGLI